MSHSTKRLVTQLLFGIDTTAAIAICAALGMMLNVGGSFVERVGYLAFAGFCSYLPDLDLLIFFPLRKRYGWTNHWVVGHHPIIVIPLAVLFTFLGVIMLGLEEQTFLTSLSGVCVTGHFIHDSTDECGLHWLSPFNWTHISLAHGWPQIIDRSKFIRRTIDEARQMDKGSGSDKLAVMSESVSPLQVALWCVAVVELAIWMM